MALAWHSSGLKDLYPDRALPYTVTNKIGFGNATRRIFYELDLLIIFTTYSIMSPFLEKEEERSNTLCSAS
jgi:hypothetical protein